MDEATIQENRRKAVNALRTTTEEQGKGGLYSFETDCYCAVGVIARELGHDPKDHRNRHDGDLYDSYWFVVQALGFADEGNDDAVNYIWKMNDRENLTFQEIADKLVEQWGLE